MVDDARNAWKWFSVHAMAWAIAIQGAWELCPPDLRAGVPPKLVTVITLVLLVLGLVGRLVKQGDSK